jgi:tryptophan 7-halogenase
MRRKRLGVIGVGSAGILSLCHFCTWFGNDWEIVSIHNPDKPILGIGESTNGGFVGLLEKGTHFALGHEEDLADLDATLKFGSRFKNWRDQTWLNPLLDGNTAIHFNSFNFKDFAYKRLARIWPEKFRVLEGDVKSLDNYPHKVVVNIDGKKEDFDYVIDAMGYPGDLSGYVKSNCTPVNRCIIHNMMEYDLAYETDHIATKHGWMFGVPLKSRKTYGYLFNDNYTSVEVATQDMKEILGVDKVDGKEYLFNCYYTDKMIEGRICKCGNKALFFEPLVANSIFLYILGVRMFFDHIMENVPAKELNRRYVEAIQEMEDVISYYYKGGSIFESPFWDFATKMTGDRLAVRQPFKNLCAQYAQLKSQGALHYGPTYAFAPLTWEIVDAQLGYNSFAQPVMV